MIALASVLFFNSCESDPCKDVVCVNGDCVDGNCACDAGFDGSDCDHQIRLDYLRTGADVTETCGSSSTPTYVVDIIEGAAADEFKVKNLGNYNCSVGDYYVVGTVTGSTSFTIESQNVCSNGLTFTGNGTIASDGTVTVNYNATYDPGTGTVTDACTAIIE